MNDLVAWLTQILDEDWADVHGQGILSVDDLEDACKCDSPEAPRRVDCPARWASDIAAKRAIIAEYERIALSKDAYPNAVNIASFMAMTFCVTVLASAYADRLGYNERWRS